ncbi:MAG TPA: FG-GAP-like repeat-containing protein, partial [Bacteroidia bacterium]|nr:FG-GAP-like repeat-containing protein [Bacteroidia bacterium]
AAYYVDVNNNGIKDLVVAPNFDEPVKGINQIWLYNNSGANNNPNFSLQKTNFLQDQTLDFGSGVAPAFLDVDNDGDLDLILANRGDFTVTQNAADRMALLRNTGTATKPEFTLDNNNDYLGLIQDAIRDMKPAFGDLNGDNKPDMVIGDQDGELHYYQNNSTGSTLSFATAVKKYMKIDVGLSAAPQIIDLDGDGLKDLVVGTGNGSIDFFKNKGTATAAQFDSVPDIDTLGGVYVSSFYWYKNWQTGDSSKVYDFEGYATPFFTQLDSAGPMELLVGSKTGKLWVFTGVDKNNLNTPFTEVDSVSYNHFTKQYGTYFGGSRIVPTAVKLSDSAGAKPAIFMGNFRGGINYLSPVFDSVNYTKSIVEPVQELAVLIYPNPTAGEITIQRSLVQYPGEVEISVLDMMGRMVHRGIIAEGNENGVITVSVAPGIYYVKLSGNQMYQTVQKVTVLR